MNRSAQVPFFKRKLHPILVIYILHSNLQPHNTRFILHDTHEPGVTLTNHNALLRGPLSVYILSWGEDSSLEYLTGIFT